MPRPWRIRYAGAKYHVTSRGNGRGTIFLGPEDYERFRIQLGSALELDEVVLYAYACMRNHTHLLVETPLGNIQRFMQRLNTAYSMYFRYKHNRPGHCLQGRYGAKLVRGDDYILRLTRYIHLNPVRTRQMKKAPLSDQRRCLEQYAWSSYKGYVDQAGAEAMVDYRWLELTGRKTMRGRREAYRRYAQGMLGTEDTVLKPALAASRYAIGDDDFCAEVEEELGEARLRKGVFGRDVMWPSAREISLEKIEDLIVAEFGVSKGLLREHGRRAGTAKKAAIELCCEFSGQSQRQVGLYFGYTSNGAAGKQRQKLREMIAEDPSLRKRVQRLRAKLS